MSEISLKFAELHNPLFLGGTNHSSKLEPTRRQGMTLTYNRVEKELIVVFNNHVAIIPSSNVASMTLANPADIGLTIVSPKPPVTHVSHPMTTLNGAQVSTPHDVVFSNQPGATGQETVIRQSPMVATTHKK